MRAVYKLANSSTSLPLLTTNIIRALFVSLKDDSLVFLIGVAIRSFEDKGEKGVCVAALRHAASFLAARPHIDFQTILPSLIILMHGTDSRIREAALDCVGIIARNDKDLSSVYGFDVVYGEESGTYRILLIRCVLLTHVPSAKLQYLDTADLSNYAKSITQNRDLIARDGNYINIVHEQYLAQSKSSPKSIIKCVFCLD
jgi:U3 small nucleolar RNA-associated protein 10